MSQPKQNQLESKPTSSQLTSPDDWLVPDGDSAHLIESLQGWQLQQQLLEARPEYPLDHDEIEHRLHILQKNGFL